MNIYTKSLLFILSGALLAGTCACTREDAEELASGNVMSFSLSVGADDVAPAVKSMVDFYDENGAVAFSLVCKEEQTEGGVPVQPGTKARMIDWATSDDSGYVAGEHTIAGDATDNTFGVYGFDKDGAAVTKLSPDSFSYSNQKWTGASKYMWYGNTKLTIAAFYPETCTPRSAFTVKADEITFDYTEPVGSADQKDLMFAYYTGEGTSGVAPLSFTHPLASVRFKIGEVEPDLGAITSVKLDGVNKSGKCTCSPDATHNTYTYAWSSVTDTTHVVGTGSGSTTSEEILGDEFTFILLPQDLAANNVKFTMTFSSGRVMSATVMSGEWKAGFTTTYKIDAIFETGLVISDDVEDNLKDNVVITNTGEATVYVRATIVGNWTDVSGNIVAQWTPSQGTFTDLPGTDWITMTENGTTVYYFKYPVKPGNSVPNALFSSYEAPECTISGGHLEMEILVQGVLYNASKSHVKAAWGEEIANQLGTLE